MVQPEPPPPPPAPAPVPPCEVDQVVDPGPALPRRLSRVEYDNSLRDLLGAPMETGVEFPPDEEMLGLDNNARALQVTPLHAERYMEHAEALAARIAEVWAERVECDGEEGTEAECVDRFIEGFGLRAWRRPITDQEKLQLLNVFESGKTIGAGSRDEGLSLMVEAMLQSPYFLFRVEVGTPDPLHEGLRVLTDYEFASRLSYLIWRTMPDDALFEAVIDGQLATEDGLNLQVERMLDHPRAWAGFWTFFAQWLHVDEIDGMVRDAEKHPDFGVTERQEMYERMREFVEEVVWSEGGNTRSLFTHPFEINGDSDDADRVGILSQPGLLAVTSKPNMSSPVHRGVFVREQLLCTALPAPPPDIMVVAPDPDPNLTTRELFLEHSTNAACAGCHQLIDPVGLAFEHFDEVGAWRAEEWGQPVDASGNMLGTYDMDGPFYGVAELSQRLADSEQVHRCVTTQVFRFAFGRGELATDGCFLDAMYTSYVDSGYDFRTLVQQIVHQDAFRLRRGGEL